MRLCEAVFRTVLMGQSKAILVKYAHMYKMHIIFIADPEDIMHIHNRSPINYTF